MSRPDISVVIPTYNRKEYLQQAIASCFDGNDGLDVEVIVVDDGSSDGTRKYLEGCENDRIRPIFQEHQGGQEARNRGLAETRGEYVKFLDDDDWLKEGALRTEYSTLKDTGADISYGAYDFIKSDGTVLKREEASLVEDPVAALITSELLSHPLRFTYRRALLEDIEWNPELPCRQDVDFALKAATKDPKFVQIDRVVGCLRQHGGERVSTGAQSIKSGQIHAQILLDTVSVMKGRGVLNEYRRQTAAEGLWKWAHLVAGQNLQLFDQMYRTIESLAPGFKPHRRISILSHLDSLVGPRVTEYLCYPLRLLIKN